MRTRQVVEDWEAVTLSPYAARAARSKGREKPEADCPIRTCFQRDRDRIIHSKSFRRLKHKTQVFIAPEGDHYRTRLTHTLEVAQIARTIARALALNEDLTEAIALGHDLGHTPFGHAGEEVLNEIMPGGFKHNEQSLRVVDFLEGGRGLNLTFEVRDGILNHTGPCRPQTLEGQVVKLADRVAYINHDIDDAIRAGILKPEDIPHEFLVALGYQHRERINTMVTDIITNSWQKTEITMSPPVQRATDGLRQFMFDHVYIGSEAKLEESKVKNLIRAIYTYFSEHPDELPGEYLALQPEWGINRVVGDYIAGMTDRFAIKVYKSLFVPRPWLSST